MSDILHNCGHITHLMKIICTFKVFSAQCIRLFDRLSVIGVFSHFSCSKKPCNRMWLQGLNVLVVLIALLGAACRALCDARRTATFATARRARRAYADGRGPLETRMVIVAPGAALDGVCPTTLPVATLSSYTQTVLTWKPAFSSVV